MAEGSFMLAQPSKTIHPDVTRALDVLVLGGRHLFDLKLDGIRCVAHVERGHVRLINRRLLDITFRYPDVVNELSRRFPGVRVVLDGEIVCWGEDGRPDFAAVHRRDAQSDVRAVKGLVPTLPATFVPFDLIEEGSRSLRDTAYDKRRARLCQLHDKPTPMSDDGMTMWKLVLENNLEGLIAKARTSRYIGGRSSQWVKLKPTRSLTAMVTGVDEGNGWRASTFGSLHLGLLNEENKIVSIGKVGTGFDQRSLDSIHAMLGKAAPLLIEVEYQEVSPDGQLRFPVFKGVRTDVSLFDCNTAQLENAPKQGWR